MSTDGMTDTILPSDYVELHCHSCFSLLDGAASPEGLIDRARALGQRALALTDHEDLGGVVRFSEAGRARGVEAIIGAELDLVDPFTVHRSPLTSLVLLAESRAGYANISTLITRARMDCPRGEPAVPLDLLARHADGVTALTGGPRGWVPSLLAAGDMEGARRAARALRDIYGDHLVIECWDHGLPEERELVAQLIPLAGWLGVPWVVANDVHYAHPQDRRVHDVLAALRHKATLDQMGTRLRPNGEWYLKSAAQMARRWRHAPEGVRATRAVAERCAFRLEQLRPTLPEFPLPPGVGEDEYLERLVIRGSRSESPVNTEPRPRLCSPFPARPRTLRHRAPQTGRLLPHRLGHRTLRATQRDPLPGARFRGQFSGLLLSRHHRGGSRKDEPPVRALSERGTRRAARHRPRHRAPRAGASASVRL